MTRISSLWHYLVYPLVDIPDRDQRQESQLLAGLSLSILLVSLIALVVSFWSYTPATLERLKPIYIGISLFLVPYGLSRFGQIHGAVNTIAMTAVMLITLGAISLDGNDGREILHFFILVPAFISVFINDRWAVLYIVALTGLILLYQLLNPELSWMETLREPVTFHVFGSGFMVVFTSYGRRRDEQQRRLLAISERERADLMIKQHQHSLLRSFIAATTHDFGTRMSLVETNRYLVQRVLEKQGSIERVKSNLENIRGAVGQMKEQLENMNTIIGLENAPRVLVDLNEMVLLVRSRLHAEAETHGVELLAYPSAMPVHTLADTNHLDTALTHLVENAITYTNSGGRVTITSRYEAGNALLIVEDTGIGIKPEDMQKVFEPFYKVDTARTTTYSGIGLGLTIVQLIADAYRGSISVASVMDKGSVFTLRLPASENRPSSRSENASIVTLAPSA